jgi:FkbM family methyltransferase
MAKGFSYYRKVFEWNRIHKLPEHDVTIETENGLLSCSNKDWLIGKHLFIRRNYEIGFIKKSIEFLQNENLLNKGVNRTVVDVGANIGMIGIAMVKSGFFRQAAAFEPSPNNFRLLKKNVEQNNLGEKILCFNYALSSENKLLELELAIGNSGDNRVKTSSEKGKMKEQKREIVQVEARKFDTVLTENQNLKAAEIDMLWLDIQGHEGHFFRGAKDFFSRRKVPCISEFWGYGIKRSGMAQEEYCRVICDTFSRFYHYEDGIFRLNDISKIKDLFKAKENPRHITSVIFV